MHFNATSTMERLPTHRSAAVAGNDWLLPDLVPHIFTIKDSQGATVIPLDQRLRCQLVCKRWRAALDIRRLPVLQLRMVSGGAEAARALVLVEWVCRVQPRVEAVLLRLDDVPADSPLARAASEALLSLYPRTVSQRPTCSLSAAV